MSSNTAHEALVSALLQSVVNDSHPPPGIAADELPTAALDVLLDQLEGCSEDIRGNIRSLSNIAASDVDGWIKEAKQLHGDIEHSKTIALDIEKDADDCKTKKLHAQDALAKVNLLEKEIVFNELLKDTIEHLQAVYARIQAAKQSLMVDDIHSALRQLADINQTMDLLLKFRSTTVTGILQSQAKQLRNTLCEQASNQWSGLFVVDTNTRSISVIPDASDAPNRTASIVDSLSQLDILESISDAVLQAFEVNLIIPRMVPRLNQMAKIVVINNYTIGLEAQRTKPGTAETIAELRQLMQFIGACVPKPISALISLSIMKKVTHMLIIYWLDPSVPTTVEGLHDFQTIIQQVWDFAEYCGNLGWKGHDGLLEWVESTPRLWLARRSESALADLRTLCSKGIQHRIKVERTETRAIGHTETGAEQPIAKDEDWNADWSDDDPMEATPAPNSIVREEQEQDDDADASAWGWEEEQTKEENARTAKDTGGPLDDEHDEAEAWGWGEDENAEPVPKPSSAVETRAPQLHINGKINESESENEQLTLREQYTVSVVPDSILEIIRQIFVDGMKLGSPQYSNTLMRSINQDLFQLPKSILAMYRATASYFYSREGAGNMLIYNDCSRIADIVRLLMKSESSLPLSNDISHPTHKAFSNNLENDITAIERFGRRAYGKEMDAQRTILKDLLDGAQNFSNCTVPPFSAECDNAVAMTVDRIQEIKLQWEGILSTSVLLQSLGSLISTVINKIIVDIEDMNDISEEDSKRLRSYCDQIASLKVLFEEQISESEVRNTAGVYTPNWFKFQYLSELLEGSLADIKYLWTEGELNLEFEVEELIDLIKALFADSEHRRRAISEIRRSSR